MEKLIRFMKEEDGSNAAEYGLILALVALAIIAGATILGNNLDSKFTTAANAVGT